MLIAQDDMICEVCGGEISKGMEYKHSVVNGFVCLDCAENNDKDND